MKKIVRLLRFCLFFSLTIFAAQAQEVQNEPQPVVAYKIKDRYLSAPFQGQLMQGYLGKRFTQNLEQRLLNVDEKGLMAGYLQRPGVHPWIGEHVGKYLESAVNVWKTTHNERLKMQMDRMAKELIQSQLADGYLGTYIPKDYWTSWDVWSHKYNLYGLLAYYQATGYQPALEACKKMGNLLCTTFGNAAGQKDIIKAGEHMGMAATSVLDPMLDLYRYTGQKKYLDFCFYLLQSWDQENGPKVIYAMLTTGNVTKVGNAKAYEMLSNFVGLAKLYRITGNEKFMKVITMAWKDIVENRLYISGTTSSMEFFQAGHVLPATGKDNMGEGCVTTTWIQLNQQLLNITGDLKYLEQIERSIYNQLLAAENPQTGCVSYYTALMDKKPYNCDISCCTSSVPRGIAMIPYFTLGKINQVPTILLYETGIYQDSYTSSNYQKINYTIKVETDFPESGNLQLTVNTSSNKDSLPLAFRVPSWCNSFVVQVGSEKYNQAANSCVTIKRIWTPGEKVSIKFNIGIQEIPGGKNYLGKIAFQRGPQVLAFDEALNPDLVKSGFTKNEGIGMTFKSGIKSCAELLPKEWIGKQAYSYMLTNKNKLVLVPYADASQTGASIKVWMPLKPTE